MSVNGAHTPSTTAATSRLATALSAPPSRVDGGHGASGAPATTSSAPAQRILERARQLAASHASQSHGALAGPDEVTAGTGGAYDAAGGENNVQSVGPEMYGGGVGSAPDTYGYGTPTSPGEAEAASYEASAYADPYTGLSADPYAAPYADPYVTADTSYEHTGLQPTTAPTPYGEAPVAGMDPNAGAVQDNGAIQPGPSAWTPEWAERFRGLMTRMGLPSAEIEQQLASVTSTPMTEEQLSEAYRQMEASIGAFDDSWRAKFEQLFTELNATPAEREQALSQLASGGMNAEQLQQTYDQMAASKPGWSEEWKQKFQTLDVPEDMLKQLEESGAPVSALQQQFDSMLTTKMEFKNNGKLDKILDAGASAEEKWALMLNTEMSDKDFDKAVEGLRSSNVPGWKRFASMGINMIPGVYALQFATGKDWLTGDKIDRTNPLNIIGAVASGFSAVSLARTGFQTVQGLRAMNATSVFGAGTAQAIEGAGLTAKFAQGLKFTDYLKAATPLVNRFGEARALATVGRGYYQGMRLASGAAALQRAADGTMNVNRAVRSEVMTGLQKGNSIDDVLGGMSRGKGGVKVGMSNAQVSKLFNENGFVQGGGAWKFNPFKRDATIDVGAMKDGGRVVELGRGVNFGTRGGMAQGFGSISGANGMAMKGVTAPVEVMQAQATGQWAERLGVTGSGPASAWRQMSVSGQEVGRTVRGIEHGSSPVYRGLARVAQVPGNSRLILPGIYGGMAVGMTGKQLQPYWDYLKEKPEIDRQEKEARAAAEQEQAQLQAAWEQHQAAGGTTAPATGAAPTGATPTTGAAPTNAASGQQVVGTAPSGGQLVFDPSLGVVVDTKTADVYDPNTGQIVGNLSQTQQSATPAATGAAPTVGTASNVTPAAAPGGGVSVDPTTGYYIDQATGLMADPATGNVYDPNTGQMIGNVGAATTTA